MEIYSSGTLIGQYEIVSRPMMGGMGVVYFALDHSNDGRPVAIKTFRPELLPDRAARDRFLREGTAWVELGSHAHIVRCYKVEYIDPTAFLVLELIAKEQNMPDASLRSWLIPGHPLPVEQALLFALQIAHGMQYAAQRIPGFVHRDLKPENVLVGADRLPGTNFNHLRVTDFGLVKSIIHSGIGPSIGDKQKSEPTQIQFTAGVGTPLYMAPEQWNGEPVGIFTDIYAFGCMLFEMLSGQPAAEGNTVAALKTSHCDGKLRSIPPNLSKDLIVFLFKCLAVHPKDRMSEWNEIVVLLQRIYADYTGKPSILPDIFTESGREEHIQAGWSYTAIGSAFIDLGKVQVALSYFEQALKVGQTERARVLESASWLNLARAYRVLGDIRKAIELNKHYLEIVREMGNRREEGVALNNLGNAYRDLGDLDLSMNYLTQALDMARELGYRHDVGLTLYNLGITYRSRGQLEQAIQSYEQSLFVAHEIGDARLELENLGRLGSVYAQVGNFGLAIEYLNQAVAAARALGDLRQEGMNLNALGIFHFRRGNMTQAISYYEEALNIAREIGDRYGEDSTLGELGSAYTQLGNFERAIACYEQAMKIDQEIGDSMGLATHSYNLALLFYRQNMNLDLALSLAKNAVEIWTKADSPDAQYAKILVDRLQGVGGQRSKNYAGPMNSIQSAFEALFDATSKQEIQNAVAKYSFMIDTEFIQAVEEMITEQSPPNLRPAFEQRLRWLKEIAGK